MTVVAASLHQRTDRNDRLVAIRPTRRQGKWVAMCGWIAWGEHDPPRGLWLRGSSFGRRFGGGWLLRGVRPRDPAPGFHDLGLYGIDCDLWNFHAEDFLVDASISAGFPEFNWNDNRLTIEVYGPIYDRYGITFVTIEWLRRLIRR